MSLRSLLPGAAAPEFRSDAVQAAQKERDCEEEREKDLITEASGKLRVKWRGGAALSASPPPTSLLLLIAVNSFIFTPVPGPFAGDRLGCICIEIVHLLRFGGTGFLLPGDHLLADRNYT